MSSPVPLGTSSSSRRRIWGWGRHREVGIRQVGNFRIFQMLSLGYRLVGHFFGVAFSLVRSTLESGAMVFYGKSAFQNTIVEGAISEALFGARLLPPILNVTQKSHMCFPGVEFHFVSGLSGVCIVCVSVTLRMGLLSS